MALDVQFGGRALASDETRRGWMLPLFLSSFCFGTFVAYTPVNSTVLLMRRGALDALPSMVMRGRGTCGT